MRVIRDVWRVIAHRDKYEVVAKRGSVAQIARQAAREAIREAAPALVDQAMKRNPKFGRRG